MMDEVGETLLKYDEIKFMSCKLMNKYTVAQLCDSFSPDSRWNFFLFLLQLSISISHPFCVHCVKAGAKDKMKNDED